MARFIVVQEDEDVYNVFDREEFDDKGYLNGYRNQEGYHISDFDIIKEFNSFEKASDYAESLMYD